MPDRCVTKTIQNQIAVAFSRKMLHFQERCVNIMTEKTQKQEKVEVFDMFAVHCNVPYRVSKENKTEFDRLAEAGKQRFLELMQSMGEGFAIREEAPDDPNA